MGGLTPNVASVDWSCYQTNVARKYRYMFTALPERSSALDDRLGTLGKDMAGEEG